jgi:hypothetical protein
MKNLAYYCKTSIKRKRFTEKDDLLIKDTVAKKGGKSWDELGSILNRDPKQVRDRYNRYLKEPISYDSWSNEENVKLDCLMSQGYSGQWVKMENFFPGRNQIQIKNQWKKLKNLV